MTTITTAHSTIDHTGLTGVGVPADILDIPTAEDDTALVLAPDGAGGVEFRAEGGGSSVWSPDDVPASPHAGDHEFGASISDGFAIGTPGTCEANEAANPGLLHIKKTDGGAFTVHGRGWTLAALSVAAPFTVTTKLVDAASGTSYAGAYLVIAEATPGALKLAGHGSSTGAPSVTEANVGLGNWASPTSRSSWGGDVNLTPGMPMYMRWVVTSSTNATWQYSASGLTWQTIHSAINPGFTVGSVCLCVSGNDNANVPCDAYFAYLRFITGTAGQTWNGYAWV